MDPLNIEIMDVTSKVRKDNLLEVTSTFIHEPSSPEFHKEGLYSEVIFGEVASPDRLSRLGWINLRTGVFHPRIYKIIVKLKGLYEEIMSGKTYAIFDTSENDFIRASEDDEDAHTGFSFFMKNFSKINFAESPSIARKTKLKVLQTYRDRLVMNKCLVIPAGLRDMKNEDGREESDEINKIYSAIINLARAMPLDGSDNTIYDSLRFALQMKTLQVYEYIHDLMSDKKGFLQEKYGARRIALGTRNVISATNLGVPSPSSPQYIKSDETMMPLFQCMKGYQPLIIYQLKTIFFSPIFSDGAAQISLVDPKNLTLSYVDVPTSEKDKFLTTDGIIDMISSYRDPSTRHMPVTIKGTDNKYYFMSLIYRDGNDVYMVRSARDMQQALVRLGKTFDIAKLSPITRAEMFYIATYYATYDKHVTVTRYPITSARSIYPSKVHLLSTIPSEEITFSLASNPEIKLTFPHFPIKDMPSVDSSSPHPAHLNNLGGDFDGDTASNNPVLSPEANDELTAHLNSPGSVVGVNGKLDVGISTDVAKLSFFNLSRDAVLV